MKEQIIGYTTGVFDLFHIGHLNILKSAKKHCDYLIVGVTSDQLVAKIKGKEPIIPYSERSEILKSIKYVDKVVSQNKIDEISDWESLGFDVIFKGSDWKGSNKWLKLEQEFSERNVKVRFFEYTNNTSSTLLREVLYNHIS